MFPLLFLSLFVSSIWCAPSLAQSEADDGAGDEVETSGAQIGPPKDVEIIRVRGRALDEIATDVPESVTSFDAATIEALGAQNITDLARVTPNVEIVSGTATQASFFIRGVGLSDFNSNSTSAVSIQQDGVSVNTPPLQLGQLYDLENVEVMRGPQSSGPNRNASAGAILVSSRKPVGDTAAQLRVRLGTWDSATDGSHPGLIQDYEGAIEIPIVDELLATRFAFRFRDAEPYKTNGCGDAPPDDQRVARRGAPPNFAVSSICGERSLVQLPPRGISQIETGLPTRVGDEHNWAARGQVRLMPTSSDIDFTLNGHGSRLDQQSTLGQAIGTAVLGLGVQESFGGFTNPSPAFGYVEPDQRDEFLSLCNSVNGQVCSNPNAGAELGENLASRRPLDERPYRGDYNRVGRTKLDTWGVFLSGEVPIGPVTLSTVSAYDAYKRSIDQDTDFTPHILFEQVNEDEAWQVWQQLSLGGELATTPLSWTLGGYYFQERLDVDALTITSIPFQRVYTQDLWSWGIWGQLSWEFLDAFTLDMGLRWNWERKRFDYRRIQGLSIDSTDQGKTWQAPTGSISLSYRFNEDVSGYLKYSRGFKAGHFNASAARNVSDPPVRPEFLDSFEAGLRGAWWEGRVSLGAAFFYYIYQDYQLFLFTEAPSGGVVLEVVNAQDAQNYGAELDMQFEPLSGLVASWYEGLVFNLRFGWLESEFIDFQQTLFKRDALGRQIATEVDYTGNRLPNSPRFQLSGSAEWVFDFGRWGQVVPRYDFAWTDETFFDASNGRGSLNADGTARNPDLAVGQPAYVIHNLRLTYRAPSGNMEVAGWVRNLEDTAYKTFAFDASQFQNVLINFVGNPRTVGADITFNW